MRNIQARRHRRLVGPISGKPTRAASDQPVLLPLDPEQADIRAWEDEGGAVHALERHGPATVDGHGRRAVTRRA
jgi:hypothetical protein